MTQIQGRSGYAPLGPRPRWPLRTARTEAWPALPGSLQAGPGVLAVRKAWLSAAVGRAGEGPPAPALDPAPARPLSGPCPAPSAPPAARTPGLAHLRTAIRGHRDSDWRIQRRTRRCGRKGPHRGRGRGRDAGPHPCTGRPWRACGVAPPSSPGSLAALAPRPLRSPTRPGGFSQGALAVLYLDCACFSTSVWVKWRWVATAGGDQAPRSIAGAAQVS